MIDLMRVIDDNLPKNWSLIVLLAVIVIGLCTAVYLYHLDSHVLYFYSDSTSHSYAGRNYVDSNRPGLFENLGTGWLPLPHLLLLPFTLLDPLFRSGFSGLLVSLPCHAITSLIFYKLIRRHTSNPYIPIMGSLLYGFNPNFLYLSLTSMTEAPFMLFFVASANYFDKWILNVGKDAIFQQPTTNKLSSTILIPSSYDLLKSSIFVSLATLCKYEAWVLSVTFLILVMIRILITKKTSQLTSKNIIFVMIFTSVSFSGIFLWLSWNSYHYGDALEFSNNPIFSAGAQALQRENRQFLYLQPLNVIGVYGSAVLYIYGPVMLVTALLGYAVSTFYRKNHDYSRNVFLYSFLVIPALFTIFSMIAGVGEMNLKHWFNSRFVILSAPLIILLSCIFINHILEIVRASYIKKVPIVSVILVTSLFIYLIISPLFTVVTFADALWQFSGKDRAAQINVGQLLNEHFDGNSNILMMTTSAQRNKIAIESGLPLQNFVPVRDSNSQSTLFHSPYLHGNYLVLSKQPKNEIKYVADFWINNQEKLLNFYDKVYEDQYFMLFISSTTKPMPCVTYNPTTMTISVTCDSANLADIFSDLNDAKLLFEISPKNWILNADLVVEKGSNIYINSTDTNWLKINSSSNIAHYINAKGNLIIDSVKITGWDTIRNDYPQIDNNGSLPRSYILMNDGNGTTNITNSEISHLGYKDGKSFGLTFLSSSASNIKNNTIHDLWNGIYIKENTHNVTIEDNEFYGNSESGIDLHDKSHDIILKNNRVYNNTNYGIICTKECHNVVMESNTIFNNSKQGIMVSKNVSNSVIFNNTIYDNKDQVAIYDLSNNNTVRNNAISGDASGIRVGSGSFHNLVSNNSISNTRYGIYVLEGSSNNLFYSNKISNTSNTAIYIKDNNTNNNTFKDNYLIDSQKNDISRSGLENDNMFVNNTIASSN